MTRSREERNIAGRRVIKRGYTCQADVTRLPRRRGRAGEGRDLAKRGGRKCFVKPRVRSDPTRGQSVRRRDYLAPGVSRCSRSNANC